MISKKLFCSSIEALRQQSHHDLKAGELIREAFGAEIGLLYNNQILIDAVIDFLSTEFDREELIFYCYCLNFGRLSFEDKFESTEQLFTRLRKLNKSK
jgi:hypothetical protein